MMQISKIAHLSDIHIRKIPIRNNEYEKVFDNLIESLKEQKPDRIVIVGDLVHDYIDLQSEQLIMANHFLNKLAEIAEVRITRGNHDCYTGNHEILTKKGWISFEDYIEHSLMLDVLTFNSEKNILEFQQPIDIIKKEFDGELKHIICDKCDFLVTPTHEILLKQGSRNTFIKKYAKNLTINPDLRIPLTSNENIEDNNHWMELLGFCLADATFVVKNRKTMCGRVQFHFKKERKIEYLFNLLNRLNIPFTLRNGDIKRNTKVICVYSEIAKKIMEFFDYKKELSYENLFIHDKIQLKSFIDGYLNGDGSLIDKQRYSCATIFKINAEILTTISNYIGYYGYIQNSVKFGNYKNSKQQYTFFINKIDLNKSSEIKKISDVPYNGKVYCLSVPNENLFIRYNNNSFISGNCRKKNLKRVDSVSAIVKTLNNPNVIYYDKTDMFYDENIVWAVWHHGEQKNNPWRTKEGKIFQALRDTSPEFFTIDLFHDPINGCKSATGFEMKSKTFYKINEFKGDISMFGDIHRMQFLDADKTKAYCGSLIAQDVTEGDDNFHGYLLWDIEEKTAKLIPVKNEYSFKNIKITPYTDFDSLDYEISNPTNYMHIRFIWGTLPQTRTKENERKLIEYFKSKYNEYTILTNAHKNEFIESEKIDTNKNITIQNINNPAVQHEIFKEFLEKIGSDSKIIEDVISLDNEINNDVNTDEISNIEWNIIKFGAVNFMSYHQLDIDWRNMDGLFQITGINTAGKTTIMKLITYILFGKALETETRTKFGDKRFVNNRNGATYCEGYLVLEANGEYYGIKKKTEINKTKDGRIDSTPTTINYYLLTNPDDEMCDNTSLEKLDEDKRIKTQQRINNIIGTYDNFKRITMTTSDTLNDILSNDMAVFIDSLLYDSGLDIFDRKLENLKNYQKKINEKNRITCDVIKITEQNNQLVEDIKLVETEINEFEKVKIPDFEKRIITGRTYVEFLTKKLFKIDPEIYNLNVESLKNDIEVCRKNIYDINARKSIINESTKLLKKTYDEERLNLLLKKKDFHKTAEYNNKLNIKTIEQKIKDEKHKIEIINGEIFKLKQDGGRLKKEIFDLKNSKICPTCGQELTVEHQNHIDDKIKIIENEMFDIAKSIKEKEKVIDLSHNLTIVSLQQEIDGINESILTSALQMEDVLNEIGELINDKNDADKYKEFQSELNQIPIKIQNEELKINLFQQKIDNYNNSLLQIEENKKIEKGIETAKSKLIIIENELQEYKEDVIIKKTSIGDKSIKIKNNNDLIVAYKEQEYRDNVINLYKKCVHRDGIPRQILVNYIIPKINLTLENILSVSKFKIWLDVDDLRPKLMYNNRPSAVIDCISASGKERTFSSVVLKFALNQINIKSKPTMFLLDEVMGKFDLEGSVEEFIEILHTIKKYMKKTLIIEHVHELESDYNINVRLDENDISILEIM